MEICYWIINVGIMKINIVNPISMLKEDDKQYIIVYEWWERKISQLKQMNSLCWLLDKM